VTEAEGQALFPNLALGDFLFFQLFLPELQGKNPEPEPYEPCPPLSFRRSIVKWTRLIATSNIEIPDSDAPRQALSMKSISCVIIICLLSEDAIASKQTNKQKRTGLE
jgi:hypothetical protein